MRGGYILIDCDGLDLTSAEKVTIPGIWAKARKALGANKLIIAENCIYGSGKPLSPVPCFGWYLTEYSAVIVGATLHIIVDSEDGVIVQDVVT